MSDVLKKYVEATEEPPKVGDILKSLDGSPAVLNIEVKEGQAPFIYGRAYVPEIVGQPLGWYLHSEGMDNFRGWKCVLLPRARADLIKRLKPDSDTVLVQSLRVIRLSRTGESILCEVNSYVSDSSVQVSDEGSDQVDTSGDDGGSGGEA